ncbi:serine/threonine-protein phosphatase 6 regulatory ankyrin repeat subunit C-like isoform X1 [Haliotis rufescens]|uniref:serine/threonine-protein phosphatase 6 regulatory ankyrin repeat subunit C-like isoform X1 n=2 Tax=Haliotis rufescens TaxID=6454 RepID=UPI00201EC75C|nr:serine/threonine-protein phosphatase 6 regulatory ankyrin repeat subunit C-like isoform X1 [Haliotis rufescens]
MGLWSSKEGLLHEATRGGVTETVTRLLDAGVSVNCTVGHSSLLYAAIQSRQYDLAKLFIKRGADITAGYYTDTPLHLASRMGAEDLVKHLLQSGACINMPDHNNCTPLWGAVAENKMAAVQVLLRHPGIDVNTPCSDRFMKQGRSSSPLKEAIERNNLELISLLCMHGADIEQADDARHKPLHYASCLGYSDVVNFLICEGSDLDVVDRGNVTPLYLACERGHLQIASMLINAGCDVSISRNTTGWKHKLFSPLHIAVQEKHTDVVRLLCSVGTDVNMVERLGKTALTLACEAGHLDIVKILIDYDADVNRRDVFGHTPLFYALHISQRNVKQKMQRANQTCTPLHQVKQTHGTNGGESFSVKALHMLLRAGAEMNCRDNIDKYSPIHYAIIYGHLDTTCTLLQYGAKIHSRDIQVEHLKWEDLSMLKLLIYYCQDFHDLAYMLCQQRPKLVPSCQILPASATRQPDSLLKLCRRSVRCVLQNRTQRSIEPLVEELPVPSTLKTFLLLQDMYDLVFKHWDLA